MQSYFNVSQYKKKKNKNFIKRMDSRDIMLYSPKNVSECHGKRGRQQHIISLVANGIQNAHRESIK